MVRELKIYSGLIRLNILSGLQYKGWPMMIIQTFFVVISDPLGTILMFSRFGSIGPWSLERILLIYALAVTSFGLAETFFRGFDYFPWRMIRTGNFDRLLLRPCSLVSQVAGSYFHLHRLPRVFSGIAASVWCLWRMGITLSMSNVIILIFALLGGFLAYCGVFVMTSGIAFFTISGLDWIYIFTNASYQVTRCPIEYLPSILRNLFTFFMPMLVVSYYPAAVVCGWGEALWKGCMAFPAGAVFLSMSLLVWKWGVSHYQSTGS